MDLAIEANRNSALFNTMQQVLDVYNPLLHKARPTVVNQHKHRIRVNPTRWGNSFDKWNGTRTVRFDMPRIGSLMDFSVKCAFKIPGNPPDADKRKMYGDRGFAKTTLTTGGLVNDNSNNNVARGRLDRLYTDRLLGFNMIRRYVVSSKSRQIFAATGEYLLVRFSQMDSDMKQSVLRATTPVDVFSPDVNDTFYAPGITYSMTIPLFMFFNEHITSALDVNFSEEVHIDIELRPPSELFYYGNIGDMSQLTVPFQNIPQTPPDPDVTTILKQRYLGGGTNGSMPWQQANYQHADKRYTVADSQSCVSADFDGDQSQIGRMLMFAIRHIQGIGAPLDVVHGIGAELSACATGSTFAFPDVDNNGDSVEVQFEGNADYLIQDTDAYRALRAQMFPEGQGLTTITYDTSQEVFTDIFAATTTGQTTLLDTRSGGDFTDPAQDASGINIGSSTRYIDLQIKTNNLCMATHFMVRKHSDMGGDGTTMASTSAPNVGRANELVGLTNHAIGAHRIYTRCLPVHYFQVLAAGRVIYESDGDTQLNLTQAGMYNGTGLDYGLSPSNSNTPTVVTDQPSPTRLSGRPFNIYSINYGLQASRLENTGCASYQNFNNPTLRIYFRPDTWSEYCVRRADGTTIGTSSEKTYSDAQVAARMGVQVDVIHEYFNVVTVNSGNGEITSGLNQ